MDESCRRCLPVVRLNDNYGTGLRFILTRLLYGACYSTVQITEIQYRGAHDTGTKPTDNISFLADVKMWEMGGFLFPGRTGRLGESHAHS